MIGDWFGTGDVTDGPSGNVYGYRSQQVRHRADSGEKVHPDEVEERLQRSPVIEDVCVISRKVRDKTQVWAIVYPNYAAAAERLSVDSHEVDVKALQELVESEIDTLEGTLAEYKRTNRLVLTDTPMPKTALRKVAREQIADEYAFDVKRWQENASAGLAP
jgi:long-subunit acyl-CoA synthetase (AMP-forming)